MVPQVVFKFSADKCKLLQLYPANYYLSNPDELSRSFICKVTKEKDFGVWCRSDMKTFLQLQKALTKAMQAVGMLKRSFNFLSINSFYFCIKLTLDRILNIVHNLGHYIWQKILMPLSKYNIMLYTKLVKSLST